MQLNQCCVGIDFLTGLNFGRLLGRVLKFLSEIVTQLPCMELKGWDLEVGEGGGGAQIPFFSPNFANSTVDPIPNFSPNARTSQIANTDNT